MIPIGTIGPTLLPLAQRSAWSQLGQRFSGDSLSVQTEDIIGGIALLVAFAVIMGGLIWLAKLKESQAVRKSPRRLFRELCSAHRLSSTERHLIHALAADYGLPYSAMLFVQPELLAEESRPEVVALRDRLFGG